MIDLAHEEDIVRLGPLARADVAQDDGDARDAALAVEYRRNTDLDGNQAAILVAAHALPDDGFIAGTHGLVELCALGAPIIRHDQLVDGAADRLGFRVSEQQCGARIPCAHDEVVHASYWEVSGLICDKLAQYFRTWVVSTRDLGAGCRRADDPKENRCAIAMGPSASTPTSAPAGRPHLPPRPSGGEGMGVRGQPGATF